MTGTTRATLDDLIARKLARDLERNETREIGIPSMGKALLFERIPDDECIGLLDGITEAAGASDVYGMYAKMLYRCCPALHDGALHTAIGASSPEDVVPLLFSAADVMTAGEALARFLGLDKIGDDAKNA